MQTQSSLHPSRGHTFGPTATPSAFHRLEPEQLPWRGIGGEVWARGRIGSSGAVAGEIAV